MQKIINFVAIFGLILSVGLLVDGAIVVVENADRRIAAGQKPSNAYGDAAKRMAWPIITSTGTTIAAFVPLLMWPGMVGQWMGLLPFTVILVLMASLLMALIFVPTVGAATRRNDSGSDAVPNEVDLVNPETLFDFQFLHHRLQSHTRHILLCLHRQALVYSSQ